jgi:AcrR family transcriptional regulator
MGTLEPSDRFTEILDAAAQLFAVKGYGGTSIRDVADSVGLLSGSLYHHIRSKEGLFLDVHRRALEQAGDRIRLAVDRQKKPWKRLEAACVALAQIMLDRNSLFLAITDDIARLPPVIRPELLRQRGRFESIFVDIIDQLSLDPKVDKEIFTLALMSTLTATATWFRLDHVSPSDIGRQIFEIYRRSAVEKS